MSKWILLNDVQVSTTTRKYAGQTIDDTVQSLAPIQAGGGTLWPATDANVAAQAALVAGFYKRRGSQTENSVYGAIAMLAAAMLSPSNSEHYVRGVVTANVANPTSANSFTVAGNDGLTYLAGQRVLLAGQTTASQNGIYIVGTVTAGLATLTRPNDWLTGSNIPAGTIVEVSEGTLWNNTQWKVTTNGTIVVDTTAVALFPRQMRGTSAAMTAGTITISSAWLLAGATIQLTTNTVGGTQGILSAPAANRTTGAGSGSFKINSSSGTDTSTVDWMITNA